MKRLAFALVILVSIAAVARALTPAPTSPPSAYIPAADGPAFLAASGAPALPSR
jgi:hypothetical protein